MQTQKEHYALLLYQHQASVYTFTSECWEIIRLKGETHLNLNEYLNITQVLDLLNRSIHRSNKLADIELSIIYQHDNANHLLKLIQHLVGLDCHSWQVLHWEQLIQRAIQINPPMQSNDLHLNETWLCETVLPLLVAKLNKVELLPEVKNMKFDDSFLSDDIYNQLNSVDIADLCQGINDSICTAYDEYGGIPYDIAGSKHTLVLIAKIIDSYPPSRGDSLYDYGMDVAAIALAKLLEREGLHNHGDAREFYDKELRHNRLWEDIRRIEERSSRDRGRDRGYTRDDRTRGRESTRYSRGGGRDFNARMVTRDYRNLSRRDMDSSEPKARHGVLGGYRPTGRTVTRDVDARQPEREETPVREVYEDPQQTLSELDKELTKFGLIGVTMLSNNEVLDYEKHRVDRFFPKLIPIDDDVSKAKKLSSIKAKERTIYIDEFLKGKNLVTDEVTEEYPKDKYFKQLHPVWSVELSSPNTRMDEVINGIKTVGDFDGDEPNMPVFFRAQYFYLINDVERVKEFITQINVKVDLEYVVNWLKRSFVEETLDIAALRTLLYYFTNRTNSYLSSRRFCIQIENICEDLEELSKILPSLVIHEGKLPAYSTIEIEDVDRGEGTVPHFLISEPCIYLPLCSHEYPLAGKPVNGFKFLNDGILAGRFLTDISLNTVESFDIYDYGPTLILRDGNMARIQNAQVRDGGTFECGPAIFNFNY